MKKIFLPILLIPICFAANGQDNKNTATTDTAVIVKHVQVEKDFVPTIEKVERADFSSPRSKKSCYQRTLPNN